MSSTPRPPQLDHASSELANRLQALSVTEDYAPTNPYATPPSYGRPYATGPFDASGQYLFYPPPMSEPYSPAQAHAHVHAHHPHAFAAATGYDMPLSPSMPAATYDYAAEYGLGTPIAPPRSMPGLGNGQNAYPTPESNRTAGAGYRAAQGRQQQQQQSAYGKLGYFGFGDQRGPYFAQPGMQGMVHQVQEQHTGRNRGLSAPPHLSQSPLQHNGQNGFAAGHDGVYGLHSPHSPTYGQAHGHYPFNGLYTPASPQAGVFGLGHRPRRSETGVQRSQKLDDYRLSRTRRGDQDRTLNDLIGYIVEFSGDQHGSRLIQSKLESATTEERQKVFDEILTNAYQLMTDVFGNYVVQKLFEHGSQAQKAALAKKMEGRVLQLSMQMYGCRVVQKALEHVLVEQRAKLTAELEGHYIECVKSSNANHVVQRLIMLDPPQSLLDAFLGSIDELASHPFGCRVLQKSIETVETERMRKVLDELHQCTPHLMEDQFGNYVIQSVIVIGPAEDRSKVLAAMAGRIHQLSRHKFASNVVEKGLQNGSAEERRAMIAELIGLDEATGTNQIGVLLRDAYGNFPVQTALGVADDEQQEELLAIIKPIMPQVRHTPCGRRLESKITQLETDEFSRAITRDAPAPDADVPDNILNAEENAGLYDETDLVAPRVQTIEDLLR